MSGGGGRMGRTSTHLPMTTQEIAQRLVALCRKADWTTAQTELFSADAISSEPYENPPFAKETKGLPAIIEKGRVFGSMIEATHSLQVSDPLVGGNAFCCTMS